MSTMSKPTYTLNLLRQIANAKLLSNKRCGLGDGTNDRFEYDMYIETDKLNSDGFVIDNAITEEIEHLYNFSFYQASCEILAGGLIAFVIDKLGGRATKVTCHITNNTGDVEVVWDKGDKLPEVPRAATWEEEQAEINLRNPKSKAKSSKKVEEQFAC